MALANITNNILTDSGILVTNLTPTTRTLTINGTTYDLSADRSWTIATGVGGSGTTNYLPKFTGASTIGNSIISESGSTISVAGNLTANGLIQATSTGQAFKLLSADTTGSYITFSPSTGSDYGYIGSAYHVLSAPWNVATDLAIRATANLVFATGGSSAKMTLTSSGNLGLGVTPSAWSAYTAIQVTTGGAFYAYQNPYEQIGVVNNGYFNGSGWIYTNDGSKSSRYHQYDGQHLFYIAPSGTAGNAISFTQAMTLNASGNLSLGNTNDTYKLDVTGTGRFTGTTSLLYLNATNTNGASAVFNTENGTNKWAFGNNLGTGDGAWSVYNFGASTRYFTIASTGAATFSSSVTTSGGGFFANMSTTNTPALTINRASTGYNGIIKFQNGASDTWILGNRNTSDETFRLYNYNVGADVLTVNNVGNVGIGTTSPNAKLNIQDGFVNVGSSANVTTANTLLAGYGYILSGTTYGNVKITSSYSNATNQAGLEFYTDNGTSTERMRITSSGYVGIGTTSVNDKFVVVGGANIWTGRFDGSSTSSQSYGIVINAGTNSNDSSLLVRNYNGSSNYLNVRGDGNVGIGTTSPSQKLQVVDNTSFTSINVHNVKGSSGGTSALMLGLSDGAFVTNDAARVEARIISNPNSALDFKVYGGSLNTIMTLLGTGNVGIGTLTPGYKLETIGNARISGNLSVGTTYNGFAANIEGVVYIINGSAWVNDGYGYANASATSTGMFPDSGNNITFKNNNTTAMYINSSRYVGINTTTPATLLHVVQTSNSETTYPLIINNQNNQPGDGWGAGMKFSTSNPSGGGSEGLKWSSIEAFDVNNYGSSSGLSFTVSEVYTKRKAMVITRTGTIGIGTTSPVVKLDIQSSSSGTGLGDGMLLKLKNTSTTTDTRSGITFGNIDGIGGSLAMQSAILKNAATGEYDMTWDLYGGSAGWQEGILYIDSNPGTVAIGTGGSLITSTYTGRLSVHKSGSGANIVLGTGSNTNNAVISRFVAYNSNNGNSGNEGSTQFYGITSIESALATSNSNASGNSGGYIMFKTKGDAGTLDERMRITSGGALCLGVTSAYGSNLLNVNGSIYSTGNIAAVVAADVDLFTFISTSASYTKSCFVGSIAAAGSTSSYYFYGQQSTSSVSLKIFTNGNIQNTNNSYGAISDARLKENIIDATPKLEDLMKVKVRNYNLKGESNKQLGVISQELEEIFPNMIEESTNIGENVKIKGVKYSVFVPMLIKAVQELKAEIETLKNK
jgi:hypothetical protein